MASPIGGHTVRVTTARFGGGTPMQEYYFVAEPDSAKAEILVRKRTGITSEEIVEVVAPLPQAAIDGLKLKPGQFIS
jgi:hypothetical protein